MDLTVRFFEGGVACALGGAALGATGLAGPPTSHLTAALLMIGKLNGKDFEINTEKNVKEKFDFDSINGNSNNNHNNNWIHQFDKVVDFIDIPRCNSQLEQ